jgi:hypothetical protein
MQVLKNRTLCGMATKSMVVTATSSNETNALISDSVYELTTSSNLPLYNTVIPNPSDSSGVALCVFSCDVRFLKSIEMSSAGVALPY